MENTVYELLNDSQLRKLKVWKTVIIVHGVCLFLLVYESIFYIIFTPGYLQDITRFFRELFDELIRYPEMFYTYATFSLVLNLFTVPRLIALYRFIRARMARERTLKHTLFYVLAILCQVAVFSCLFTYLSSAKASKPIIYLYPETRTEVNVKVELDGRLTVTYPAYDETCGWSVTADPDGTLTDKKGRQYSYLYWEGDITIRPDMSRGFCVKGEDTAQFLEGALKQLGLNDKEADDFITYWLPLMQDNKYNVITFQTKAFEDVAALHVSPKPDTVIRVNMLWYPSNANVGIKPQDLTTLNPTERKGFTVVEWGGEEYKKGAMRLESMV